MKIGLIDVDGHNFPNLALMKISAWHKKQGDSVEWCFPLDRYDIVYQSKVFDDTYSPDIDFIPHADKVIKGGTGYGLDNILPSEIEHIYPDYHLYPELTKDTAYGFLTRGCPRGCEFCIVADKEGRKSYKVADLSEFWRGQKHIELLDPNILACKEHLGLLQRERQRQALLEESRDSHGTVTQCHAIEEDKEEDKEKEFHSFTLSDEKKCSEEDKERIKLRYMGGTLGQNRLFISDEQFEDLCDRLSWEELDKYIKIVVECEKNGKSYKNKSHYQAILDMVNKDRKIKK